MAMIPLHFCVQEKAFSPRLFSAHSDSYYLEITPLNSRYLGYAVNLYLRSHRKTSYGAYRNIDIPSRYNLALSKSDYEMYFYFGPVSRRNLMQDSHLRISPHPSDFLNRHLAYFHFAHFHGFPFSFQLATCLVDYGSTHLRHVFL